MATLLEVHVTVYNMVDAVVDGTIQRLCNMILGNGAVADTTVSAI